MLKNSPAKNYLDRIFQSAGNYTMNDIDTTQTDLPLFDIPVGRIATAEDIAYPILFLAAEEARHINGEILNVNGGSVLCG
jgi:NAD(P)-dependent dehydrogenase (short-subunit alcohol dehydrogenase family)